MIKKLLLSLAALLFFANTSFADHPRYVYRPAPTRVYYSYSYRPYYYPIVYYPQYYSYTYYPRVIYIAPSPVVIYSTEVRFSYDK